MENALVSANDRTLSVEKGVLISFLLPVHIHFEQYRVSKLFPDRVYDMSLCTLANNRANEFGWCRCKSSSNPYAFDTREASVVAGSAERGRKRQSYGAALAKGSLPAILLVFCMTIDVQKIGNPGITPSR